MNSAVSISISLLLIIVAGYLLRGKIKTKDQKDGIKTIILSLALPVTIFIALLKIQFTWEMVVIPLMALGFNLLMYELMIKLPLKNIFGVNEEQYRTLIMLVPSLAPGLSCFPFILEYFGDGTLAMAALADVGNKVFVLIIMYSIAMNWYVNRNEIKGQKKSAKIKSLMITLIREPVNLMIISAIIILMMGLNYHSLPAFARDSVDRVSLIMTPLVLLFIGISIKLNWRQVRTIISFLFFRSGIAFLISGFLLMLIPVSDVPTIMLIIIFPQSACSFWPYAHMSAIDGLENKLARKGKGKTFDLDFAINVLAFSLPFSTVLILTLCTFGEVVASVPEIPLVSAGIFLAIATIPALIPGRVIHSYANKVVGVFK